MTIDAAEALLGQGGAIYIAPVGTSAPGDLSSAWPAGWDELGLVDQDGFQGSPNRTIQDFFSWQEFNAIRSSVTEESFELAFNLQQWNSDTVMAAFGGGVVTVAGGVSTYTPPSSGVITEKAIGLEVNDGDRNFRFVFKRCRITSLGTIQFSKGALAQLNVTFSLLASSGVSPWTFISDDTVSFFDTTGS